MNITGIISRLNFPSFQWMNLTNIQRFTGLPEKILNSFYHSVNNNHFGWFVFNLGAACITSRQLNVYFFAYNDLLWDKELENGFFKAKVLYAYKVALAIFGPEFSYFMWTGVHENLYPAFIITFFYPNLTAFFYPDFLPINKISSVFFNTLFIMSCRHFLVEILNRMLPVTARRFYHPLIGAYVDPMFGKSDENGHKGFFADYREEVYFKQIHIFPKFNPKSFIK